jgi:hypothetical protein
MPVITRGDEIRAMFEADAPEQLRSITRGDGSAWIPAAALEIVPNV